MSHFVGIVFGNNIDELLEQYYEGLEVDEYVLYTKEAAIAEAKEIHTQTYERNLKFVEKHTDFTSDWEKSTFEKCTEFIKKGPSISDEEAWKIVKNWGYKIDENENLISTYNPNSKWDWYVEGGRWERWLLLKDENSLNASSALKKDVDWNTMLKSDRIPFCFVTEEGDWHESASMGWWAITSNEKNKEIWKKEFLDYLELVEDDVRVSVIDFHI